MALNKFEERDGWCAPIKPLANQWLGFSLHHRHSFSAVPTLISMRVIQESFVCFQVLITAPDCSVRGCDRSTEVVSLVAQVAVYFLQSFFDLFSLVARQDDRSDRRICSSPTYMYSLNKLFASSPFKSICQNWEVHTCLASL